MYARKAPELESPGNIFESVQSRKRVNSARNDSLPRVTAEYEKGLMERNKDLFSRCFTAPKTVQFYVETSRNVPAFRMHLTRKIEKSCHVLLSFAVRTVHRLIGSA